MALIPSVLEAKILLALKKQAAKKNESDSPEQSAKEMAADIAAAVDAYIRTATITSMGASPSGPVTVTSTIIA